MQINDSGISSATLSRAVKEFYAGKSATQIATRCGVNRGVLSGRFERGGVVRVMQAGAENLQFDAEASATFAQRVAYGFTPVEAGASLGKTPDASRRHAAILGLGQPESIKPMAALGGGVAAGGVAVVSREHDDAHVAAVMAQGGFDRCDFETGWVVGTDGALRYPFTQAAADAARALIADAQAKPRAGRAA
jgi:hypothetical protein